jgi:hypothetical protein
MNEEEYVHSQLLGALPCTVKKRMSVLMQHDLDQATGVLIVTKDTTQAARSAAGYEGVRSRGIRLGILETSDEIGAFKSGTEGHAVYGLFDYALFSYWHAAKQRRLQLAFPSLPKVWVPLGYSKMFRPPPANHITSPGERYLRCNFMGAFSVDTDREKLIHALNSLEEGACFVRAWNRSSGLHHSQALGGKLPEDLPLLMPARYRDILIESIFTLAPGGGNEESYRVYEALAAGSIPVIKYSAAWTPFKNHPLPVVSSWTAENIRMHLELSGEHLMELHRKVQHWWAEFLSERQHVLEQTVLAQLGPSANYHCLTLAQAAAAVAEAVVEAEAEEIDAEFVQLPAFDGFASGP